MDFDAPAYLLEGACIDGPDGRVLGPLELRIPQRGVTAIMGPGGVGKSSLLHALAGTPPNGGFRRSGTWLHRGRPLDHTWVSGEALEDVAWVAQRPMSPAIYDPGRVTPPARWREAFSADTRTILLDEPGRGIPEEEMFELKTMLQVFPKVGTAVVVTHDQALAREVGDWVCLMAAGRIVATGRGREFFENPPNRLAQRFVRQGNCWPTAQDARLPSHFHWLIPDQLAGSGAPGLLDDQDDDLLALTAVGITHLFTLTEEPLADELLRSFGLSGRHFPIADMKVPSIRLTAGLCRAVERVIETGGRAVLHCRAGLGRTGTMLAAYLVWQGEVPGQAIERVRLSRKGSIQNRAQEQFVYRFAEAFPPRKGQSNDLE